MDGARPTELVATCLARCKADQSEDVPHGNLPANGLKIDAWQDRFPLRQYPHGSLPARSRTGHREEEPVVRSATALACRDRPHPGTLPPDRTILRSIPRSHQSPSVGFDPATKSAGLVQGHEVHRHSRRSSKPRPSRISPSLQRLGRQGRYPAELRWDQARCRRGSTRLPRTRVPFPRLGPGLQPSHSSWDTLSHCGNREKEITSLHNYSPKEPACPAWPSGSTYCFCGGRTTKFPIRSSSIIVSPPAIVRNARSVAGDILSEKVLTEPSTSRHLPTRHIVGMTAADPVPPVHIDADDCTIETHVARFHPVDVRIGNLHKHNRVRRAVLNVLESH